MNFLKLQKKLDNIMKIANTRDRFIELKKFGKELGISTKHLETGTSGDEESLLERIYDGIRLKREHGLWIIAVISALISVISAIAAWTAVFKIK